MVVLKGNSIQLRTLKPADLEWLLAVENDEQFWEVSNTVRAFTKAEIVEYIANAHLAINTAKQYRFVIVHKKERIGLIDLFDYDTQHHRAGVGILVLPKFRLKGYATEALELLLNYAFKTLHIHQLYANIATDNTTSFRLFENLKFKLIGTKKDWFFTKGNYKDTHLLQLINKND